MRRRRLCQPPEELRVRLDGMLPERRQHLVEVASLRSGRGSGAEAPPETSVNVNVNGGGRGRATSRD